MFSVRANRLRETLEGQSKVLLDWMDPTIKVMMYSFC